MDRDKRREQLRLQTVGAEKSARAIADSLARRVWERKLELGLGRDDFAPGDPDFRALIDGWRPS